MINNSAVAETTQTSRVCPEVWEGTLTDGTWFYLSLWRGMAELGVGATRDAAWGDALRQCIRIGDDLLGVYESKTRRDDTFAALLLMRRP